MKITRPNTIAYYR